MGQWNGDGNGRAPAAAATGPVEIAVLHQIPGRMRLGLPLDVVRGDPRYLEFALGHCPAVRDVSTNTVTRNALVVYDPAEVAPTTLLKRAALATQLRVSPRQVQVPALEKTAISRLSPPQLAAGGLLLLGLARAAVLGWNSTPTLIDSVAAAATGYAVLEKGLKELSQDRSLTPDTLSFVYLLSTVRASNPLPAALFTWLVNFGKKLLERRDPSDFTLEDGDFCKGCVRDGNCSMFAKPAPINKVDRHQGSLAKTLPAVVVLAAVLAFWRRSSPGSAGNGLISNLEQVGQEHQQMADRMQLWGQVIPFLQM
jgi:hypothetical protein